MLEQIGLLTVLCGIGAVILAAWNAYSRDKVRYLVIEMWIRNRIDYDEHERRLAAIRAVPWYSSLYNRDILLVWRDGHGGHPNAIGDAQVRKMAIWNAVNAAFATRPIDMAERMGKDRKWIKEANASDPMEVFVRYVGHRMFSIPVDEPIPETTRAEIVSAYERRRQH